MSKALHRMGALKDWATRQAGRDCPLCWPRPEVSDAWYFIARLEVSSLYLSRENQAYRGAAMLIYDASHVTRLGELSSSAWSALAQDLYRVEVAQANALKPDHVNVGALGNIVPHLHWHLIPRYQDDPRWGAPIWTDHRDEVPRAELAESEYAELAALIKGELGRSITRRMTMKESESTPPRVLMVLTSHDELGSTGRKTGFWLEEFAAPYYVFVDAGVDVTLASPAGGQPPLDPTSTEPEHHTDATRRFLADDASQRRLTQTRRLADIDPTDFDAVFYPGGHGPLWDLVGNADSIRLIRSLYEAGKPVAAVCHAPAVLTGVQRENGEALVAGRRVTGFTNSEEAAVGLTEQVPFLLEDRLKSQGGRFGRADDWAAHVEVDGHLVTGQNPASSAPAAEEVLRLLRSP